MQFPEKSSTKGGVIISYMRKGFTVSPCTGITLEVLSESHLAWGEWIEITVPLA